MWKTIIGIKTEVGLSAFSLALTYLLADKIIEKGMIKTSYEVAFLLIFLFLLITTNLIVITFYRKNTGKSSNSELQQKVSVSKNVTQHIQISGVNSDSLKIKQDTTAAKGIDQKIKSA